MTLLASRLARWFVSAGLTVSLCAQTSGRHKIVIDQDSFGPGGSNLQAILMALQMPDVDVLGITVEGGDGWVDENTAHLLRMLELIGRTEVKVYRGATYPLINSYAATKRREEMYGKIAYKGAWTETWDKYNNIDRTDYHGPHTIPPMREGSPTLKAEPETATNFLLRVVRRYPGEVTIIALGPETNIALAASLDEEFAGLAKELVLEGGSFNPTAVPGDPFSVQFVNTPRKNFNFAWDPEAAHIVLHAPWKKITVVPTDATTNTKLTEELVQRAVKSGNHAKTPIQTYLDSYANRNFPMWDEVGFAVWYKRSLILNHDRLAMDVDTNNTGPHYGATLSWGAGKGPGIGEPDVEVVHDIDVKSFEEMFVETMGFTGGLTAGVSR